jgi:aspartate kinase
MIAYGEFGNGSADLQKTRKALPDSFDPIFRSGTIPIVTGFFGRNEEGQPLTFGRGGSDYAAAVLADALSAERLEIWKDVDGFLSGSPEIVENGRLLHSLSYDEAAELAYFGAKILHPRSVEPLLDKNIPIVIRNTFKPGDVGTWIGTDRYRSKELIKSVTFDRNVALLRIHGADVGYAVGLLSALVSKLSGEGINIRSVMTAQTCINILLDKGDLDKAHRLIVPLHPEGVDSIEGRDNIGLVAVVGEGLSDSETSLAQVMTALNEAGTHVEMVISGASKVAAYFIVKADRLEGAVRTVHDVIFAH